jgi:hypothetical protein
MNELTLERYRAQEREMAVREAKRGLRVHAGVTVLVTLVLVAVNVFVVPAFPWSVFPALGMAIGVWFHWYFGVRHGDQVVNRHQREVESEATRHAA